MEKNGIFLKPSLQLRAGAPHVHTTTAMGNEKKKQKIIKWDEITIAAHDKERGTRQKIDEAPTPYRYGSESDQSEAESGSSDGELLLSRRRKVSAGSFDHANPDPDTAKNTHVNSHGSHHAANQANLAQKYAQYSVLYQWEAVHAKLMYEKHLQDLELQQLQLQLLAQSQGTTEEYSTITMQMQCGGEGSGSESSDAAAERTGRSPSHHFPTHVLHKIMLSPRSMIHAGGSYGPQLMDTNSYDVQERQDDDEVDGMQWLSSQRTATIVSSSGAIHGNGSGSHAASLSPTTAVAVPVASASPNTRSAQSNEKSTLAMTELTREASVSPIPPLFTMNTHALPLAVPPAPSTTTTFSGHHTTSTKPPRSALKKASLPLASSSSSAVAVGASSSSIPGGSSSTMSSSSSSSLLPPALSRLNMKRSTSQESSLQQQQQPQSLAPFHSPPKPPPKSVHIRMMHHMNNNSMNHTHANINTNEDEAHTSMHVPGQDNGTSSASMTATGLYSNNSNNAIPITMPYFRYSNPDGAYSTHHSALFAGINASMGGGHDDDDDDDSDIDDEKQQQQICHRPNHSTNNHNHCNHHPMTSNSNMNHAQHASGTGTGPIGAEVLEFADEKTPAQNKQQFYNQRAGHYNEYKVLLAMRANPMADEEEEEENDDEDED